MRLRSALFEPPRCCRSPVRLPSAVGRTRRTPIKQIKLTEQQVKSFIAAQPDLATMRRSCRRRTATARCGAAGRARGASPRSTGLQTSASSTTSPPTSRSSWRVSTRRSGEFTDPRRGADEGARRRNGRHLDPERPTRSSSSRSSPRRSSRRPSSRTRRMSASSRRTAPKSKRRCSSVGRCGVVLRDAFEALKKMQDAHGRAQAKAKLGEPREARRPSSSIGRCRASWCCHSTGPNSRNACRST